MRVPLFCTYRQQRRLCDRRGTDRKNRAAGKRRHGCAGRSSRSRARTRPLHAAGRMKRMGRGWPFPGTSLLPRTSCHKFYDLFQISDEYQLRMPGEGCPSHVPRPAGKARCGKAGGLVGKGKPSRERGPLPHQTSAGRPTGPSRAGRAGRASRAGLPARCRARAGSRSPCPDGCGACWCRDSPSRH